MTTELRTGIDPVLLTKEDFIKMLVEDLAEVMNQHPDLNRISFEIDYNYSPKLCSLFINPKAELEPQLDKAFEALKQSKNWPKVTGWNLRSIMENTGRVSSSYEVRIEMQFEESYMAEVLKNQREECARIHGFYNSLSYKGD